MYRLNRIIGSMIVTVEKLIPCVHSLHKRLKRFRVKNMERFRVKDEKRLRVKNKERFRVKYKEKV